MRRHEERDEVGGNEDARAAARRIVEQVLAEHESRGANRRGHDVADAPVPAGQPLIGRVSRDETVTATASDEALDADAHSSARRTARRIVDEVLATYAAARESGPPVATLPSAPTVHSHDEGSGSRAAHAPIGPIADLDDDHPLVTARRIVEQVLAEERAREQAAALEQAAQAATTDGVHVGTVDAADAPLVERLFVLPDLADDRPSARAVPHDLATVPPPAPDPSPGPPDPDPVPEPAPDPDPIPEPPRPPVPEPGPFPTPDPDPQPHPDPLPPQPDPEPTPVPPDPEPQPLGMSAGTAISAPRVGTEATTPVPVPSEERREAEETARRIVQEVVAAHETAAREREESRLREEAMLTEQAIVLEEVGLAEEFRAAEEARRDEQEREQQARDQESRLAAAQTETGPYLDELPHPELSAPPIDGPPPIPDAARRESDATAPLAIASLETAPPPTGAPVLDPTGPTTVLPRPEEEPRSPRTGRWLLTTIIGAVALALLFPLAVQALRSLITLGG